MDAGTFIAAFAGLAGGAVVAWLLAERKYRAALERLRTAQAVALAETADARSRLTEAQAETQALRERLSAAETSAAALQAQTAAVEKNLHEQKLLLDQANAKLTQAFAAVSAEALEKNNAAFLAMAQAKFETLSATADGSLEARKAQIETLLKPLQELLTQYQIRLTDVEKARVETYGELRQQIGGLLRAEGELNKQTTQLIAALTRPQVRGQWGELALRRLVEMAGMSDRCDFVEQESLAVESADGSPGRLRPDLVVKLPGERSIVIDAKAVMGAFLDASEAPDDAARKSHMARHATLVRSRAKDLAGKAYWNQFAHAPEFVVLFLPGEAFLYAAVEHDPQLIEDCLNMKIILATPTTLMALLKTVAYGWRQEAISDNAETVRKLGSEIYDRLAVLANHFVKLGGSLDTAVRAYNDAVASLETRLLVSARKMGELGVTPSKQLPEVIARIDRRPAEFGSILNPDKGPMPIESSDSIRS